MMKKNLWLSVAFLLPCIWLCADIDDVCCHNQFRGFNVDVGVGYSGIELDASRSGIKPQSNTTYGSGGVALQLRGEGGWTFYSMYYASLEVYGQYNSAKTENRFYETVTSTIATTRVFDMPWNVGLDVRLGVSLCPSNLIFVFGGPDWGYYHFCYVTGDVDDTLRKFKTGGFVGAGLQQFIAYHWSLRATFDYRWYGSEEILHANGETQTIKARLATALFILGYTF